MGSYPSGSYGYDISNVPVQRSFPTGDHTIGIVQVDGASCRHTNPCLPAEAAWAGGGLNLYIYLTYGTSATNEPGCNGDQACNAGYQAGLDAYQMAVNAGVDHGDPVVARRRDPMPNWSPSNPARTRSSSRARSTRSTRPKAVADVGIYTSPGVWNSIVGNYAPSVPYWMADYLHSPSGPGSCADYYNWVAKGQNLPGPPEIVQYNSAQFDEDYAC